MKLFAWGGKFCPLERFPVKGLLKLILNFQKNGFLFFFQDLILRCYFKFHKAFSQDRTCIQYILFIYALLLRVLLIY